MTSMKLSELTKELRSLFPIEDSTYANWHKALAPLGDISIEDVNKKVVRQYRQTQLKEWTTTTLVTRIGSLKGIWNKAIEWEYYEGVNPWIMATKGLPHVRRNPEFYDWDHYEQYHDDPYFVCLWYSGMRIGELAGISKENIIIGEDVKIPYFNLVHQPNRRLKNDPSIRKVPIHPACLPYVERLRYSKAKEPGKSWSETFGQRMNLPKGEAAHTLRHSFTSRMIKLNIIDRIQDALLGHAPATKTGRYGRVELDVLDRELRKLR